MEPIELIGWAGSISMIIAYFLLSIEKMSSERIPYHCINFFGAIGVGIMVYDKEAWPALVLEIVWAFIAASSILRLMRN
ncbi:MAG: hypothetical protein Q7R79_05640 [bacterium]|nr:hypothetical protein [bacterium]